MILNSSTRLSRRRQFFRPLVEQLEDRRLLATVTVNTTSDVNDGTTTSIAALLAAPGADNVISLREAITAANNTANVDGPDANVDPDPDTINFNIPGAGVQTIDLTSPLPTITNPLVIDGYSQPGASANTLPVGNDAVLLVELNGNGVQSQALTITAGASSVRGLVVNRFSGFAITVQTAGGNTLEGNWIGLSASGGTLLSNGGDIFIGASLNNLIGGTSPASRNALAGSASNGSVSVHSGGGATIQGNYVGMNAQGTAGLNAVGGISIGTGGNLIGGTGTGAGNVISGTRTMNIGVGVGVASNNTVQGNTFGLAADGNTALANSQNGVTITSSQGNTIGGTTPAARNVFAVRGNAIEIVNAGPTGGGNTIQGNYIGTNVAGTAAPVAGGTGIGVLIANGTNNLVGGAAAGEGNLISGKTSDGIQISNGTGTLILGNRIGVAADGVTPLPNLGDGIEIGAGTSHRVGGTTVGESNTIAFNSGDGLFVNSGAGYALLGNSIHSNAGLGIDLGANGVTINDAGDADTGANNLQNFPVLTQIIASATQTAVQGTLNSAVGGTFRIELFANAFSDLSCCGEGQIFLDAITVTDGSAGDTDPAAGNVSFSFTVNGDFRGQYLTLTATNETLFDHDANVNTPAVPRNDTSEFSLAYAVTSFVVTNTADSGAGSLRQAITCANLIPNIDRDGLPGAEPDVISFNIPGTGVKTIAPTAALPTITDPVIIDGYTQGSGTVTTADDARPNTLAVGNNAVLLVELNGTSAAGSSGLVITGGDSTVRGLVINRFPGSFAPSGGIVLSSSNNVIEGNFIGLDPSGNTRLANTPGGVRVVTGANNLIGGTTPAARNVISGNGPGRGNVTIDKLFGGADPEPIGTLVRGNYIGTNAAGTAAIVTGQIGNAPGVLVLSSTGTIIGGSDIDDGVLDGNVGARNLISGNFRGIQTEEIGTTYAASLMVQGNFIGVNADGTAALGNALDGIFFQPQRDRGDNFITIGGTAAGAGNVISGNVGNGVSIVFSNVVMQGNYIGTDLTGALDLGNGFYGIDLQKGGSPPQPPVTILIGGTAVEARNIISGNDGNGLRLDASVNSSIAVQGNYIGAQSDGQTPLPNALDGIVIQEAAAIGGTVAGAGNLIAFNGGRGVNAPNAVSSVILANSIFANGPTTANNQSGLGIDLFGNGVTPNDANDPDTGPNGLQNFPVITGISGNVISGTLNSIPSTVFRIEFFASDAADPSGFGEGQTFLGAINAATDINGNTGAFTFDTSPTPIAGKFITATATRRSVSGLMIETSEFSASMLVPAAPLPTLSINDVSLNEGNAGSTSFTFTVTLFADPSSNVTATVNTANGTSSPATTADGDYQAITNQILTFLPGGPLTQTVTVTVVGDLKFEPNETFLVNLSSATGATIADGQGLGTIQNDDAAPTLTVTGGSVLEGNLAGANRIVPFTLSLSAASGVEVSGTVSTSSVVVAGIAAEGVDFVSADGVAFTIPAGQTQATVLVSVIEDKTVELDETFTLTATATDAATLSNESGTATGDGTIQNDDTAVVTINDVTVNEGAGSLTFTVSVSNPIDILTGINVTYGDTSTSAGDFDHATDNAAFAANTTTPQTVTVAITNDNLVEATETFLASLSVATFTGGRSITTSDTGIGTITDNDAPPVDFGACLGTPGTVTLMADPRNPGKSVLFINGTAGHDVIVVQPSPLQPGHLWVVYPGVAILPLVTAAPDRIAVCGQAGHDVVTIDPRLTQPTELRGGDGNDTFVGGGGPDTMFGDAGIDTLVGGSGHDILLGGAGTDYLVGGLGSDLLIGGQGADQLHGQDGGDLLIGSSTSHDNNFAALQAISDEWSSGNPFNTRIANLAPLLNAATVQNDSAMDYIFSSLGRDWILDYAFLDLLFDFNPNATTGDRRN